MSTPSRRWDHYPALIDALHQRDWSTLARLYREGAPGRALFPAGIGSQDLDPEARSPQDGRMVLPVALLIGHALYQQDPVHPTSLPGEPWDEDGERTMGAIQDVLTAWQAAGGRWDEIGVEPTEPSSDDPLSLCSLTAFAADHLTPVSAHGFSFVHFENDVEPWLARFLKGGWVPGMVERAPLAHWAVRTGQPMFAQTLIEAQTNGPDTGRDGLDNTPLHALGRLLPDARNVILFEESLKTWLEEQPEDAWSAENADGHTPFESWLVAQAWDVASLGLQRAREQGLALRLNDEVRALVREQAQRSGQTTAMLNVIGAWERDHLRQSMGEGTETAPARTLRRL